MFRGGELAMCDGLLRRPYDVAPVHLAPFAMIEATKIIRKSASGRLNRSVKNDKRPSRHLDEKSLALIGNVSARKCRGKAVELTAETFSMRRLGGSRWRLRRTRGRHRTMEFEWPFFRSFFVG